MNETRYLTCAETAKLVRGALKRAFPGVKFSVRSSTYSMGASIDVSWSDGPTESAVQAVTGPYEGSGFDGMIDLKYSCESWLAPDGTAYYGYSGGTIGSRGVNEGYAFAPPAGAQLVHFGADSVSCRRRYSETFARTVRDFLSVRYGHMCPAGFPDIRPDDGYGSGLNGSHPSANVPLWSNGGATYPSDVFYRLARVTSERDLDKLEERAADTAGV